MPQQFRRRFLKSVATLLFCAGMGIPLLSFAAVARDDTFTSVSQQIASLQRVVTELQTLIRTRNTTNQQALVPSVLTDTSGAHGSSTVITILPIPPPLSPGFPTFSPVSIVSDGVSNQIKCGVNTFSVNNECGVGEFKNAVVQCYDNYETMLGEITSCKSSELWQQYAKEVCANHCSNGGVSINIGDRVQTTDRLNIRVKGDSKSLKIGLQNKNSKGTVIGGPIKVDGTVWWEIDFDMGADGFAFEKWITIVTDKPFPPPGKFMIGDQVRTTENIFMRLKPGKKSQKIKVIEKKRTGEIIGGPVHLFDDTNTWWQVNYDKGDNGWSAEEFMDKIAGATLAPPIPAPSLVVLLSPNGGETVRASSTLAIHWTSTGVPSSNLMTIGLKHTVTDTDYALAADTLNDGSETLFVPMVPVGPYVIFIKTIMNGQIIADQSDTSFTVSSPLTNGLNYMRLPVPSNVLVNGEDRSLYRMRITASTSSDSVIGDFSANLSVNGVIVGPFNVGVYADESFTINGHLFDPARVNTQIISQSGDSSILLTPPAGQPMTGITMPAGISRYVDLRGTISGVNAGDTLRVEMLGLADQVFSAPGSRSTTTIMVQSPNGGEGFYNGTVMPIRLSLQNPENFVVALQLVQRTATGSIAFARNINGDLVGDSTNWTIPNDIPAGQYLIEGSIVRPGATTSLGFDYILVARDDSDAPFTIKNVPPPTPTPTFVPSISSVNGKGGFGPGDSNYILGQNFFTTKEVYLLNNAGKKISLVYSVVNDGRLDVVVPPLPLGYYVLYVVNSGGLARYVIHF